MSNSGENNFKEFFNHFKNAVAFSSSQNTQIDMPKTRIIFEVSRIHLQVILGTRNISGFKRQNNELNFKIR